MNHLPDSKVEATEKTIKIPFGGNKTPPHFRWSEKPRANLADFLRLNIFLFIYFSSSHLFMRFYARLLQIYTQDLSVLNPR